MKSHESAHDDEICFMRAKDVELTVEEAAQFIEMKNSENITSVPRASKSWRNLFVCQRRSF